jgi:hypothetical protein
MKSTRRTVAAALLTLALGTGLAACAAEAPAASPTSAPSTSSPLTDVERTAVGAALDANPDYSESDVAGVDVYLDGYAVMFRDSYGNYYISEVIEKEGAWQQLLDDLVSVGTAYNDTAKSQPKYVICMTLTKDQAACSVKLEK